MQIVHLLRRVHLRPYSKYAPYQNRPCSSEGSANLLLVNLKSIAIRHFKRIRAVLRSYASTIEEKADRVGSLALSLTKRVHELFQLGGALDFEKDLIVVVCDFDVEMLGLRSTFGLLLRTGGSVLFSSRHGY